MPVMVPSRIQAPWPEWCYKLLIEQQSKPIPEHPMFGDMIPDVCPTDKQILNVDTESLFCAKCGYKQIWCYDPNW